MFGRKESDYVLFGETKVEIPKLTIEKWELLIENLETLPQIIVNVLSAKHEDNFTAKLVVGASLALSEVVKLVAVVTDLEEDFVRKNADHNSLYDFIKKTMKKNDLNTALKKFQTAIVQITKGAGAVQKESPPSMNG